MAGVPRTTEIARAQQTVWVFMGAGARHPSAVFQGYEDGARWIVDKKLTGVLTEYPVGVPVVEWAVATGIFPADSPKLLEPKFVAGFTSASMNHVHFEDGRSIGE